MKVNTITHLRKLAYVDALTKSHSVQHKAYPFAVRVRYRNCKSNRFFDSVDRVTRWAIWNYGSDVGPGGE